MKPTKETPSGRKKGPASRQAGTLPSARWAPYVLALLLRLLWFRANSWERGRKSADVLKLEAGESEGPPPVLGDTSFFLTRTEEPQMLASGSGLHADRL